MIFQTTPTKDENKTSGLDISNVFSLNKQKAEETRLAIKKMEDELVSDVKWMTKYQKGIQGYKDVGETFNDTLGKASDKAQSYAEALKNGTITAESYEKAQRKNIEVLKGTSSASEKAALGAQALSVAMNIGIAVAVGVAMKFVNEWIHVLDNLQDKIASTKSEISTISEELDRFDKKVTSPFDSELTDTEKARLQYLKDYKTALEATLLIDQAREASMRLTGKGDNNPFTNGRQDDSFDIETLSGTSNTWVDDANKNRSGTTEHSTAIERLNYTYTELIKMRAEIVKHQEDLKTALRNPYASEADKAYYSNALDTSKQNLVDISNQVDRLNNTGLLPVEIQLKVNGEEATEDTIPSLLSTNQLSTVLTNTETAMSSLSAAYKEQYENNEISIETLSALMTQHKDWMSLVTVENGIIKLNSENVIQNAKDKINAKIEEIESSIEAAEVTRNNAMTQVASLRVIAQAYVLAAKSAGSYANAAGASEKAVETENAIKSLETEILNMDTGIAQNKTTADALRVSLNNLNGSDPFGHIGSSAKKASIDAKTLADAMLKAEGNAAIKSIDKRIKALQKQMSLLDEQYKKEDDLLKLQKAKAAWEQINSNRNTMLYTANTGWKNVADPKALKEAEDNLKEIEKEKAREDAKKLLQDEIDKLNELKEKYQESMSHIGETLEEHMLEMQLMAEFDGMSYEQMATNSDSYTARVIANLNAESQAIANRNKVLAENATSSFDIALPSGQTVQYDSKSKADMAFENAMMHFGDGVKKKYATGGVNDFTGIAQLDGSPTAVETIFNASDGKKLFDLVHNSSNLTADLADDMLSSMRLQIPRTNLPQIESNNKPTMENYNFYGELSFPNVTNENDARKFIDTFRQIVNQKR